MALGGASVRLDDADVILAALERRVSRAVASDDSSVEVPRRAHLVWFIDGVLLFFLISRFGTRSLRIDNDLYYAIFIWAALTFWWAYARATKSDTRAAFGRRWRLSLFLGLLSGIYVVVNVLRADATARPSGPLLLFEIMWRGLAYGACVSLMVAAFPAAVAFGLFRGDITGFGRRVGFAALALVLVWAMTAAYHLGFEQFQDDGIRSPELSATAVSVPVIVTANPIGSIAAHTAMYVVATVRTYESRVFVPPHVEFVPDYEPPGVFGPH